jgi:hypothetical protein
MHSTRKKKNSGAERSGVSGPGPECSENPETPGKSQDSSGFSTAEKSRLYTVFQSSINCLQKIKSRVSHHKHTTKFLNLT